MASDGSLVTERDRNAVSATAFSQMIGSESLVVLLGEKAEERPIE